MTKYVLHAWATAAVLHIHKVVARKIIDDKEDFFLMFFV